MILEAERLEVTPCKSFSGTYGNRSWTLHNSDAMTVLKQIESNSIDCIVTSPPYFWLRDYGSEGQIGLEDSLEEYINTIVDHSKEMYRVLREDGVYFINLGDTYYSGRGESKGVDAKSSKRRFGLRAVDKSGGMGRGIKAKSILGIPWRVAIALSENGWILRSPIIWDRVASLPEAVKDRPKRQYEYVFMLVKSRKYTFNREVLSNYNEEDIWSISVSSKDGGSETKSAPFPIALANRCIEIGSKSGGVVLDPFVGSGTSLVSALKLGRDVIGIELNEEIFNYALNSVKDL